MIDRIALRNRIRHQENIALGDGIGISESPVWDLVLAGLTEEEVKALNDMDDHALGVYLFEDDMKHPLHALWLKINEIYGASDDGYYSDAE